MTGPAVGSDGLFWSIEVGGGGVDEGLWWW